MKKTTVITLHLLGVMAVIVFAASLSVYLDESFWIFLVGATLLVAIFYSFYWLFNRSEKKFSRLKQLWKAFFDFIWGL